MQRMDDCSRRSRRLLSGCRGSHGSPLGLGVLVEESQLPRRVRVLHAPHDHCDQAVNIPPKLRPPPPALDPEDRGRLFPAGKTLFPLGTDPTANRLRDTALSAPSAPPVRVRTVGPVRQVGQVGHVRPVRLACFGGEQGTLISWPHIAEARFTLVAAVLCQPIQFQPNTSAGDPA